MPTGVIFDMDGVLVASARPHAESWRMVAKKHGITMTDAQFRDTFGRPSRDIIRILWEREVGDEEIHAIDTEKEALYREIITGVVPLTIGVREVLGALQHANLPIGVATSGPPENLELVLREGRLTPFFGATVNGFEVKHGKPAPDCFLLAAQRLGVDPSGCVVIEDAPAGVQAGVAAGMHVIGLTGTKERDALQEAGAHQVIDDLRDVPELVFARP